MIRRLWFPGDKLMPPTRFSSSAAGNSRGGPWLMKSSCGPVPECFSVYAVDPPAELMLDHCGPLRITQSAGQDALRGGSERKRCAASR